MVYQPLWVILIPKPSVEKLSYLPRGGNKGIHTFSNGISSKENIIVCLEIELADYDLAIQPVSHHAMRPSPLHACYKILIIKAKRLLR